MKKLNWIQTKKALLGTGKEQVLPKKEGRLTPLQLQIMKIQIGESIALDKEEAEHYREKNKVRASDAIGSYLSMRLNNAHSTLGLRKMKISCRTLVDGGVLITRIK
jgi:hypothetical protein